MYYIMITNHNIPDMDKSGFFIKETKKGKIKLSSTNNTEDIKVWKSLKRAICQAKNLHLTHNSVVSDTLYIGCTVDILDTNGIHVKHYGLMCNPTVKRSEVIEEQWESLLDYYIRGEVSTLYQVERIQTGYGMTYPRVTCKSDDGSSRTFILKPELKSKIECGMYINPDRMCIHN